MPNAAATLSFEVVTALSSFSNPRAWEMVVPKNNLMGLTANVTLGTTVRGICRATIPIEILSFQGSAGQNKISALTSLLSFVNPSISLGQISPNPLQNGSFPSVTAGYPVPWATLPALSVGLPNTIVAGGNASSATIPTIYMPHIVVSVTSSQNGSLSVQRYVDAAGLIAQGSALTAAITGGSAAVVDNADGKACGSIIINVTNTGAVTATVTKVTVILLAK